MERKKIELAKRLQKYAESLDGIRQPRVIDDAPKVSAKKSATGASIAQKNKLAILAAETQRAEARCAADLEAIARPGCTDVLIRAKNLLRFIGDNRVDKCRALNALLRLVQANVPAQGREAYEAMSFRIARDIEKHRPQGAGGGAHLDVEAQLLHCGDMMQWREPMADPEKVDEDIHTYGFVPEPWQRQMISAIGTSSNWLTSMTWPPLDERKSVLVCAPTSSGKTFISFYVIESVLREDENAVIAFVLPTKALVNQVYAEIQASFKKYYKHDSTTLVGIFTADQRMNSSNCSVLVVRLSLVLAFPGTLSISSIRRPCRSRWRFYSSRRRRCHG